MEILAMGLYIVSETLKKHVLTMSKTLKSKVQQTCIACDADKSKYNKPVLKLKC